MKQKYTSADTSINSKKRPAIYGKVNYTDGTVIDYGCGKHFDEYGLPANVRGYDPYNRPDGDALNGHYDKAFCSNVLNVIAEKEVRNDILKTMKALADVVYITVYEGDGTGKGKPTKKDCYQLNRKTREYLDEVREVFQTVSIKRGVIIAR